jgi:endonuclease/exonuclease/phosphatase family metal-dependent hydrolase
MVGSSAFAARRRISRSSKLTRIALICGVLLCLLLSCRSHSGASSLDYFPVQSSSDLDSSRQETSTMTLKQRTNWDQEPVSRHADSLDGGAAAAGSSSRPLPLRIVTFNIRYANTDRSAAEQPWSVRGPKLATQLKFVTAGHESPFICIQECLHEQLQDIKAELGDSWSFIGRGRDDGKLAGEFSPVFYRSDNWSLQRCEMRWLSETPDRPSLGWDADSVRVVTMGEFSHKATGKNVIVMATHFDHIGLTARENSAKLLIKFANEWATSSEAGTPDVLIGGDFNSKMDGGAYKLMTAPGSGMSDISTLVPSSKHYGNYLTFTSFGQPGEAPSRIDFLFIRQPKKADIKTFGILANSFDDQIRFSDHRAVVVDMDLA